MTFPSLMMASAQPGEFGLFHVLKSSSTLLRHDDAGLIRCPETHPVTTARVRTAIALVIVLSFTGRTGGAAHAAGKVGGMGKSSQRGVRQRRTPAPVRG